jgi:transposase-like protein
MAGKKGKRYPRDFRLKAARLVVEGGYSYRLKQQIASELQ